ncbi:hypothetical protein [Bradyrhizobium sp. BR 1432]|uniref:hypothetical protein n=1 Tax=Bradyrhizobium sp. BR 1432 TaxID=3447966 RepID=UPI003EE6B102
MRDAVVVAREDGCGDKRLVGYVVCAPEAASNGQDGGDLAGTLRAHIKCAPAGVHGAIGVRATGGAAADGERQAGPQGAAGAGR